MKLTCNATTTDNKVVTYSNPLEFTFSAKIYYIADKFTALFPIRGEYQTLKSITVLLNGKQIFYGMIDRQSHICKNGGKFFKVECTKGCAQALQNQVQPVELRNISSSYLLDKYGKPYGIYGLDASFAVCPYMKVTAGMTAWDVIDQFCRLTYTYVPFIDRSGYIQVNALVGETFVIGNAGNGHRYTERSYVEDSSNLISCVHMKNPNSSSEYDYSISVSSTLAPSYGIQRERYYRAPESWKSMGNLGAGELIRNAKIKSKLYEFTFPNILDVYLGDYVRFTEPEISQPEMYVGEVTLHAGGDGYYTKVTLYDGLRT